jgi:hypothetical protein
MERHCLRWNGTPKHAFATKDEALANVAPDAHVYPCQEHGWHRGGVLSRALRSALYYARRRRRIPSRLKRLTNAARKSKVVAPNPGPTEEECHT